jgi:chemotaxis response regulator CheB
MDLLRMSAHARFTVSRRILVADDSRLMRKLLCRAFHEHIYFEICAEASDGAEAVRLAIACKPDLVILDLAMPGMSGSEAGKKIRALYPSVPIILFSLHAPSLRPANLPWVTRIIAKEDVGKMVALAEELVAA